MRIVIVAAVLLIGTATTAEAQKGQGCDGLANADAHAGGGQDGRDIAKERQGCAPPPPPPPPAPEPEPDPAPGDDGGTGGTGEGIIGGGDEIIIPE